MKFAAGLTVSGIVGFILLEVAKLLMPAIAAGIVGFLALLLKILLIAFVIVFALGTVGLVYFFYRRSQRNQVEV
jgi:flagellar basal body-associated protein FliL